MFCLAITFLRLEKLQASMFELHVTISEIFNGKTISAIGTFQDADNVGCLP
jgi:hypothetical protein